MSNKKKIKKYNKKKNPILPCSRINVTRYTYEAWKKCYPQSDRDEWEIRTFPDYMLGFVYSVAENIENNFGISRF